MNLKTAALLLALGACRYQNMNAEGKHSPAPYDNLKCIDGAHSVGYSFEVPSCDCAAGIRLTYTKEFVKGGVKQLFVYESGFGDVDHNVTRMVSNSSSSIDELVIGGRKLAAFDKSDDLDKILWKSSTEAFSLMWENYGPVFKDMKQVCDEEMFEREYAIARSK